MRLDAAGELVGALDRERARLAAGDPGASVRAFTEAGGAARAAGRLHEAADCYAAALARVGESDEEVDGERLRARQRECWDGALAAMGAEAISIAWANTTLPGVFVAAGRERRPLLVIDHGSPDASSGAWAAGGATAAANGWHWMTFDGPGRARALHEQDLVLRTDWEWVLAAVLDAVLARDDVDPHRVAVVGAGHAGHGILQALTAEHRAAAAVLAPRLPDAASDLVARLPAAVGAALRAGDASGFARELHLAELFTPGVERQLRHAARGHTTGGRSLYETYRDVLGFQVADEAIREITTPTLVCAAGRSGEPAAAGWVGQQLHSGSLRPWTASLDLGRRRA